MKRNTIGFCLATSLFIGISFWGGWESWHHRQTAEAWTIQEPTELLLHGVSPGQKVETEFHLTNTSRLPLRLLGCTAC